MTASCPREERQHQSFLCLSFFLPSFSLLLALSIFIPLSFFPFFLTLSIPLSYPLSSTSLSLIPSTPFLSPTLSTLSALYPSHSSGPSHFLFTLSHPSSLSLVLPSLSLLLPSLSPSHPFPLSAAPIWRGIGQGTDWHHGIKWHSDRVALRTVSPGLHAWPVSAWSVLRLFTQVPDAARIPKHILKPFAYNHIQIIYLLNGKSFK